MPREISSNDSLTEASRNRAEFSGHGDAKGASGFRPENIVTIGETEYLGLRGEITIVNPRDHGFGNIWIDFSWDNVAAEEDGGKRHGKFGVDLDLGCLYELQNGERGAIQPFGKAHGSFDQPPFIVLSCDERTGDAQGVDEFLYVNGNRWPDIKRILIYAYIYGGAENWQHVLPQVRVTLNGERPMTVTPDVRREELPVCVIASLENVRNGIKLTNYTEYYAGHAEMDRAFGFGLQWDDGHKDEKGIEQ